MKIMIRETPMNRCAALLLSILFTLGAIGCGGGSQGTTDDTVVRGALISGLIHDSKGALVTGVHITSLLRGEETTSGKNGAFSFVIGIPSDNSYTLQLSDAHFSDSLSLQLSNSEIIRVALDITFDSELEELTLNKIEESK